MEDQHVDYYFLDTEERKEFAQNPHEYLIETTQEMTSDVTGGTFPNQLDLTFNHPVKELVWVVRRNRGTPITAIRALATNGAGPDFANALTAEQANEILAGEAAFNFEAGDTAQETFDKISAGALANAVYLPQSVTFANGAEPRTYDITFADAGINEQADITTAATEDQLSTQVTTLENGDLFTDYTSDSVTRFVRADATVGVNNGAGEVLVITNAAEVINEGDIIVAAATAEQVFESGLVTTTALSAGLITTGITNTCSEARLLLNGQERFVGRNGLYFNGVQPYQHHTGNPDIGINCYSFAINPEDHQPSGTCNFSRVDNASLEIVSPVNGQATVMAHGYNVLRVASGMGGLAYSN